MKRTTTDASSPAITIDDVPTADRPGAHEERHALKRTYLTLLPHTQLVELCLAFEAYSPLHVKSSLWPTNLVAAVAELQSVSPPSSRDTVALIPLPPDGTVQSSSEPMGELTTGTAIDPRLSSDNMNDHSTATADQPSSMPQQPRAPSDDTHRPPSHPKPSPLSAPAVPAPPQGPCTPSPYNYPPALSHPAYPHTPYYTPFNHAHGFPPQPPASYPHAIFPPSHAPLPPTHVSGSPFPSVPLARLPHPMGLPPTPTDHSGIPADDLPSYEEMLVEALRELNEPDGSAPKTLFTWMASRYPLHTNFRPSASQALQKAFKRGRLEKGSHGKYRLNASWDGGSTSKRTTRRPQSFVQMGLPAPHGAPTTSPFTHAPLSQPGRDNPSSMPTPSTREKIHYSFQFPPGATYPRYGQSAPPPVSKDESSVNQQSAAAVPDATAHAAEGESNATNEEVGEGSDAWEAAQAILKAINFGSAMQALCRQANGAFFPAHTHTGSVFDRAPASDDRITDTGAALSHVQVLSDRDRASLQAQLALLAAQLAEIAEDTLSRDLNVTDEGRAEEGNGAAREGDDMEAVDIPQLETNALEPN
ncbi:hypothetical protein F5148DRAFT_1162811 [Russula earlei]|uniref:Uncharacterized protein n=1 Tax=Russula earlei TaxID=71964 RepID=A0ACC0UM40_9AGAM|nr:hypothetical protein F5148DRAFT_1162811 [Russula earlei]